MPGVGLENQIRLGRGRQGIGGPSFLLDNYPGAAAAYSLRKLREGFGGPVIRVRRGSDNVEQEIGFDGDVVDTQALLDFANSKDVFVVRWYDQSPNQRDADQGTQNEQPQVVSGGSIITKNGSPAISADGSDSLSVSGISTPPLTLIAVVEAISGASTEQRLFGDNDGSSPLYEGAIGADGENDIFSSGDDTSLFYRETDRDKEWRTFHPMTLDAQQIVSWIYEGQDGGTLRINGNNNQTVSKNSTNTLLSDEINVIFRGNQGSRGLQGTAQELLFYSEDKSEGIGEVEDKINEYYATY